MSRVPISTYRLQLGPDLTFDGARDQLPYLHHLGITDLYLSPVLQAAPGSTHGYDVVDHDRVSDVMGGRERLEALCDAAHELGMGIVLDIVPNHMAVPTPVWHNRALWSVLAHGVDSPYADWFDVEWNGPESLLMPVLGDRIGAVIARGEITVEVQDVPGEGPATVLRYFEHSFPVRAGSEHLPLTQLLQAQHYRLAYWRVADEELNYRRFFDVDTLLAVRVERPAVFDATHRVIVDLVRSGHVDGLRIDHPDGLADPRGYLRRLFEVTDGAWIVAEKILEPAEDVPSDWPVAGTTGYDAAWRIGQVLHDPAGTAPLAGIMHQLAGDDPMGLAPLLETSKRQVVQESLHAEVNRLAVLVAEVCSDDIRLRDHTWRAIRDCVTELVIALDGYRAYVVPGEVAPGGSVHQVAEAAARAASRLPAERADTLAVVVDLVLGRETGSAGRTHEKRRDEIIVRFQQVCGAVTAKGVEDTAFYRWTHLVSLCEVGGSPASFSIGPDALHAWAGSQQERHPATMTAGTTHDTKRGADVRARLGVLTEHAGAWVAQVAALRAATADARPPHLDGRTENLLWQMLAGTWTLEGPLPADRLTRYLVKAAREAKDWTRWTAPDEKAETALVDFAAALSGNEDVRALMTSWAERTAPSVRAATLAQVLLQLSLPGVADVYQGTETTRIALVDPDNRGPVDHRALAATLERLETASPATLAEEKLLLVAGTLRARRRHADAVVGDRAGYQPLPTSSGHAIAFARTCDDDPRLVTVVTRLSASLAGIGGWGEHQVVLPSSPSGWVDARRPDVVHAPGPVLLRDLLAHSPAVLLEPAA